MPVHPRSYDETSMDLPQPKRITIVADDSIGPGDESDAMGHHPQNSRQKPGSVKYQKRIHPTAFLVWSSALIFCGVFTIIIQAIMFIFDAQEFFVQISIGIWSGVVCIIASVLGFCLLKNASIAILSKLDNIMVNPLAIAYNSKRWIVSCLVVGFIFAMVSFCVNMAAIAMGVLAIRGICHGPPDFFNQQCRVLLILNVVNTIFFIIGGLCSFAMVILSSQGICCSEVIRDYTVDLQRNEPRDVRQSLPHVPIASSATIVPLSIIDEDNVGASDRPQPNQGSTPNPGQFVEFLSGKSNSGFDRDEPISKYGIAQGPGPRHGKPFDPKDFRNVHLRQQLQQENRRLRQDFHTRPSLKPIIS